MSDLNPTTRALLDLGREGDDPNEHALAQNRRSLNVKLGAAVLGSGVVAGSASKAAAAVGAWSAAKLAVVCGSVILGGVVTLAAIELQRAAPPSHAAVAAPPRATTNQPRESAHASEPRSEADQAVVAEPVAPEPATRAAPSSRAPAPRSIQEELELIRGAQRLLNRNDPRAALAMLNEHAQRFPSGALWEEREASRVFALCKLGNARAARASADTFVRKAPHSPFVDRVRAACQAPSTSGSP